MSGIWWLALYPSAAVIAVYMWICGKKRSYLDGVAAVQANSDDIESVGTCVHSVCIMTDPWTTAEMMKRFKGKVVGFVSLRPVPHTLYAAPAPRCFPLPLCCLFSSLLTPLCFVPLHSLSFATTPTLLLHSIGIALILPTSLLSLQATFLDHPRFARFKSLLKRRPLLWSYWEEQDEIDISRTVYCALPLYPSAHTPHPTRLLATTPHVPHPSPLCHSILCFTPHIHTHSMFFQRCFPYPTRSPLLLPSPSPISPFSSNSPLSNALHPKRSLTLQTGHFVPHTRPTTWSDLQDELGDHLSVGLDPSRPLWQIHVYEQYEGQNGEGVKKTAMIFKVREEAL